MSSQIAKYSCTFIPNLNNTDKMKPDANGYYKCIVGAFNTQNHSGVYYPLDETVKSMFKPTGIIGRKLDSGLLTGEYSHPDIEGKPFPEIMARLAFIDPKLESHHFRKITLESAKDEYGKPLVLTLAELRPQGPYGQYLKDKLDNPDCNVAFSIRSFTVPTIYGGMKARLVKDIISYDFVQEPGLKSANQYNTANTVFEGKIAGMENLVEEITFTDEDLNKCVNTQIVGLESTNNYFTHVRTSLGWKEVQVISPVFGWK